MDTAVDPVTMDTSVDCGVVRQKGAREISCPVQDIPIERLDIIAVTKEDTLKWMDMLPVMEDLRELRLMSCKLKMTVLQYSKHQNLHNVV